MVNNNNNYTIKNDPNYQFLTDMDKKLIDELDTKFPETKINIKMIISVKESPMIKKLIGDFYYYAAMGTWFEANQIAQDLKWYGVLKEI